MSQFIVVLLGFLAVLVFVIASAIRRKLRFKKRLAAAWGSRERVDCRPDSESSLYESFLLDEEAGTYDSLVDDQTWGDLDFFGIFQDIDTAAQSSLGSEYLYSKLRLLHFEVDQEFDDLQAYLTQHPEVRNQLQLLFSELGKKNHNQAKKLIYKPAQANHKGSFYLFLAGIPLVSPLLYFINPSLGYIIPIISMAFNIVYSMATRWSLEMKLDSMGYLVRIFYIGEKIARLPLPQQAALKEAVASFSRTRLFGEVFRPQSGASELEIFYLYINSVLLIPQLAQAYISNRLVKANQQARQVLEILGRLEAAIAALTFKHTPRIHSIPSLTSSAVMSGKINKHRLLARPVS